MQGFCYCILHGDVIEIFLDVFDRLWLELEETLSPLTEAAPPHPPVPEDV
jgi:hypothetical protein